MDSVHFVYFVRVLFDHLFASVSSPTLPSIPTLEIVFSMMSDTSEEPRGSRRDLTSYVESTRRREVV